jgi:hypothetical protein
MNRSGFQVALTASVHRRVEDVEVVFEPTGVEPDELALELPRATVRELRHALALEERVVKGHRHVEERNALGHRELELVDLERWQVHVVDQVVEPSQVAERALLDDASLDELGERQRRDECPDRVTVARGPLGPASSSA